jgi:predicted Zn-dependent peptidase
MKALSSPRFESLENGVWVATESLPHVRSASIGVYLDTGSRDETPGINGLAHFFEHMVFKGTAHRNPLDIVQAFEATGGNVNAYTSKEQTCFHGKIVDTEVEGALDALLDMVFAAKFDPADVKKEKEVIIEEIHSVDDNPDEFSYELFSRLAYGAHPLARPIAGTPKSVRGLTRAMLVNHRESARKRTPVAVVAVGNVKHSEIVAQVRRYFKLRSVAGTAHGSPRKHRAPLERSAGLFKPRHAFRERDVQQATVILGGPGYGWKSPERHALLLLHCVLGDGMSSRLFQNLRETHGLVYGIFSNPEFLSHEGVFNIGFATEPRNLSKAVREIGKEAAALREKGLTAKELEIAKENIIGGILLGLESTNTRMGYVARQALGKRAETLEQSIERIKSVTRADALRVARDVLRPDCWASAAVTPKGFKPDLGAMLAKA